MVHQMKVNTSAGPMRPLSAVAPMRIAGVILCRVTRVSLTHILQYES